MEMEISTQRRTPKTMLLKLKRKKNQQNNKTRQDEFSRLQNRGPLLSGCEKVPSTRINKEKKHLGQSCGDRDWEEAESKAQRSQTTRLAR